MITNYIYRTYVYNSHEEEEQSDFENDLMEFVQQLATQNQEIRNRIPEINEVRAIETILIREMMFNMFPLMFTNFIRENLYKKITDSCNCEKKYSLFFFKKACLW